MLWQTSRRPISAGTIFLEECTSLLELPVMVALQFRLKSKKFFAWVSSPTIWEKTRVEYVTRPVKGPVKRLPPWWSWLLMELEKGGIGMIMTFCSHNWVMMEASEAPTALHQCDSPEPRVFMVRRYTSTPFIPKEPPGYSTLMWVISPRVLLLPNFFWIACVLGSYFHIQDWGIPTLWGGGDGV